MAMTIMRPLWTSKAILWMTQGISPVGDETELNIQEVEIRIKEEAVGKKEKKKRSKLEGYHFIDWQHRRYLRSEGQK